MFINGASLYKVYSQTGRVHHPDQKHKKARTGWRLVFSFEASFSFIYMRSVLLFSTGSRAVNCIKVEIRNHSHTAAGWQDWQTVLLKSARLNQRDVCRGQRKFKEVWRQSVPWPQTSWEDASTSSNMMNTHQIVRLWTLIKGNDWMLTLVCLLMKGIMFGNHSCVDIFTFLQLFLKAERLIGVLFSLIIFTCCFVPIFKVFWLANKSFVH